MTHFYTISVFRQKLSELLKVRKNVYTGVLKEIYLEFINCPIETIRNNRDMILIEGDSIIIKLRLPDKKQRLSRKDGYRLIYLVSREDEEVTFLTIYPKNGPNQRISISKEELKEILAQYALELASDKLELYSPLDHDDQ